MRCGAAGQAGAMSRDDVTITPYRGPVRMTDQDGNEIALDRDTVALCRCGKSRLRPFCDGSHRVVRFQAPSGPEARGKRWPGGPGSPG
jgi:CDGSH-type Zn-finger protein